MNIWLIHPGELLPVDKDARLFRYSYLAEALCNMGHKVVRFAPTFAHATKTYRAKRDSTVQVNDNYTLCLLHAGGYSNNRSLARFRFNLTLAKKFEQQAERLEKPDAIVCGIPCVELCTKSVTLGARENIPVIIDIRDLWPDIYLNLLPSRLRGLGKIVLQPFYKQASNALASADSIVAVSKAYAKWGAALAKRPLGEDDRVIPLGAKPLESKERDFGWLLELGVRPEALKACFLSQFESSYDIHVMLEVAERLEREGKDVQIILAGKGSLQASVEKVADKCSTLVFTGWLNREKLEDLLIYSDVGLAAYSKDALQSLPNKPFEYMSAELAIVNSLEGEAAEIIESKRLGANYRAGDAKSLFQCLDHLSQNPKELKEFQQNSKTLFDESFNVYDTAKLFASHIDSIGQTRRLLDARKQA